MKIVGVRVGVAGRRPIITPIEGMNQTLRDGRLNGGGGGDAGGGGNGGGGRDCGGEWGAGC